MKTEFEAMFLCFERSCCYRNTAYLSWHICNFSRYYEGTVAVGAQYGQITSSNWVTVRAKSAQYGKCNGQYGQYLNITNLPISPG